MPCVLQGSLNIIPRQFRVTLQQGIPRFIAGQLFQNGRQRNPCALDDRLAATHTRIDFNALAHVQTIPAPLETASVRGTGQRRRIRQRVPPQEMVLTRRRRGPKAQSQKWNWLADNCSPFGDSELRRENPLRVLAASRLCVEIPRLTDGFPPGRIRWNVWRQPLPAERPATRGQRRHSFTPRCSNLSVKVAPAPSPSLCTWMSPPIS